MAFKAITIVLFPDGTNKVKQFRLPRFLLVFFILLIVSSAAFLSWIIRDYINMKMQMPLLAHLQKENEQQKRQFVHLARRIHQMTQKMRELQQFDRNLRVMVNLEIPDDSAEIQGVGGSEPTLLLPDYSMAKTHKDLVRLLHRSLDSLNDEIAIGKQDRSELHKLLKSQKIRLASTPSISPTRGWLSSRFGYRNSPFTGEKEFHKGIDIATKMNTPVVAPANGIVSSIRWERIPGKVLYINHGYGMVTKYAHLQKVLVQKGQDVKRGETVALVGNAGRSTAPHLHYEVHLNGVPTDPLRYVSRDALSIFTDRPTKEPATSTLHPRSLQVATYEKSKPNGAFNTAQKIAKGIIVGRRGTASDLADYYKVRATGNTMILRLEPSLKDRDHGFIMIIFDADQRTIGELGETATTITLAVKPQAAYYIKLDLSHAPVETPQYQLHVHFS
ncbi:MAG: M23 family metallopeptidase [Desulfobacterales bacterium]|nr:M23 family metallopeptidase [Desulfobacterales bacterium]